MPDLESGDDRSRFAPEVTVAKPLVHMRTQPGKSARPGRHRTGAGARASVLARRDGEGVEVQWQAGDGRAVLVLVTEGIADESGARELTQLYDSDRAGPGRASHARARTRIPDPRREGRERRAVRAREGDRLSRGFGGGRLG